MTRQRKPIDDRARRSRSSAALSRPELRAPSTPRVSPSGPMSAAIKAEDPATRAMIDAAIAARQTREAK